MRQGELDGVEIVVSGHLLDSFWTPLIKQRTDEYGGSLDNRMRFAFEVLEEVRCRVGDSFIVGMRVTGNEALPGGLAVEDCLEIASRLASSGFTDYLNIVILLASTTGLRCGELCALRCDRDIDLDNATLLVAHSIVEIERQGIKEGPTKNRQVQQIAIDNATEAAIAEQMDMMAERAIQAGISLQPESYLFSDALNGSKPWRPGALSLHFRRLRELADLGHLKFHSLRKFMETHGQDLGFSAVQVAIQAGHDPAVARKHDTGKVDETDRRLAEAISAHLLGPPLG